MKRNILTCALGASLALMFSAGATPSQAGSPDANRVLVKFKHGNKAPVQAALRGAHATIHYSFDDIDTFAATVPAAALNGLRHNPNIEYIEADQIRNPTAQTVPYGIDLVQARDVWDADRDGAIDAGAPTGNGIMVCVIDSGIHAGHEDFAGVNIVGGFPAGQWNFDNCGHGTHVAGTIAAANNGIGVVGVSPGKVSMFFVKVFGDQNEGQCAWTFSSTLIAATNRCADAGARVINMSLGGGAPTNSELKVFQNLAKRGVLSIAAAGNSGNPANSTDAYSYPASYPDVVSVAAIDSNSTLAGFSQKNDAVDLAGPGVSVLSTYPFKVPPLLSGSDSYDSIPMTNTFRGSVTAPLVSGGLCTATDASWAGKVVLCSRGSISFLAKSQNVYNSGGIAAVVSNNTAGALNGTLGANLTVIPPIPVVGITQADGQALLASHIGDATTVNTVIQSHANGYAFLSGTSMATPHVVGVAALVWSANPGWTRQQVLDALEVSAKDLGTPGYDVGYGWGLVQAKDALDELQSH
ncbi:MAG TPA: S8 family serine peptidase [Luteimonas sp.]|nr:S8 family serine peptidase [Luteimonas sp.]